MPAYQSQLAEKTARLAALLAPFAAPPPAVYPSPPAGYRMRAEFRVWHDGDDCYLAMTNAAGERVRCDNFPPAYEAINRLMTPLMAAIRERPALRYRLFQAEFHAAQTGEVMVSLVYHRPLDDAWQTEAQTLAAALGISLIGRAPMMAKHNSLFFERISRNSRLLMTSSSVSSVAMALAG